MTYKQELQTEHGINYEGFRGWLKNKKGIAISDLDEVERIDYVYEYKEVRRMSKFESKYGFPRKSFISHLQRVHGINYSDLEYDEFMGWISVYGEYRLYKDYSHSELIELLEKYIVGASNGSEIELTEKENKLITHLEENL